MKILLFGEESDILALLCDQSNLEGKVGKQERSRENQREDQWRV